ncbi:GNAT family N-acetyltransferase [Tepidiforma sp.]|uniref:GNAT family N-acetyltransferase n=1 Tax=Tepidiforma sp. TaxID=2682230 RepID=UPI002ADDEC7A|nr:GNAT family N-acetyltransferase [Tepidiforma sp.]
MANTLRIRPCEPPDLSACARLLAARHRRDRQRLPWLEPAFEDPLQAASWLAETTASPFSDGVIAEDNGSVVGFLVGQRLLLPPTDISAQFVPPRTVSIGVGGHAVAADSDPTTVYRAMYAELAARWVAAGLFTHRVAIVPGDRAVEEAWVSLGFGRAMTAATRRTADPVEATVPAGVEIGTATPSDLDAVVALSDELAAHHWRAPMFWPVLAETSASARQLFAAALASEVPCFLALERGQPVGMQLFLDPGFTPPIVDRRHRLYLFEGVVSAAARGGGIGSALLAASMRWARERGHELCTLHWAAANYSGAPFWLGHGFVPVEHTMERRVDDRVTWARPRT